MSQTIKTAHKLSDCDECFRTHYTAQKSFPAKPVYTPPHIVQIDMPDDLAEATFIALSMESLDNESMVRYGHAFVDGLTNHKKVDKHRTKSEQSQEKRKLMIQCRDAVEHEMTKAVPKTILKENESLKGYNRKRLSEFYDGPSTSKKKKKTHSPNFDTVTWDKRKVIDDLHQAESQGEKINWSCFAREHGVEGKNGGQVVKEFAILSNINTTILDKQESKSRSRSTKKKIPGYQISIPTFPPVKVVKAAWTDMVESGELLLGVTCTPYTITRYVTEQGKVKPQNIKVEGRKIPLKELRAKLLSRQEKYMHLYTDAKIDTTKVDELKEAVQIHNLTHPDTDIEQLKKVLRTTQQTRYLTFWHDHATMLGRGYIMMTVHTIFDPAVFNSTREDDKDTVQTLVEEPYMYMFGLNSSSIEDQATLIVDRVDCLEEMDEPLIASNGVPVTDIIRFFVGDHTAKQFERGTQCGGVYKCGSCGCKSSLIDDQAHALQCSTRSLTELQALAIGGVLGKVPCTVKPLYVPDLVVKDIRKELVARGVKDVAKKRIE